MTINYEHSFNLQMQNFETKKRISYHLEGGSKHMECIIKQIDFMGKKTKAQQDCCYDNTYSSMELRVN